MNQEQIANPVVYDVTTDDGEPVAHLLLNPKVIKEKKDRRRIGKKLFLLLQEFIVAV